MQDKTPAFYKGITILEEEIGMPCEDFDALLEMRARDLQKTIKNWRRKRLKLLKGVHLVRSSNGGVQRTTGKR